MNLSSLVKSVETANTEVADTGVEINGVRITGTTRPVGVITGMASSTGSYKLFLCLKLTQELTNPV